MFSAFLANDDKVTLQEAKEFLIEVILINEK